ncbi:MAG: hypothetical protein OEM26_05370, partial [Saprospiraceae bacterium]|nr:hypothetical protein [Saprospiraceae bacterium]
MLDPGRQALIQKNKALKQALAIEAALDRIRNLTMEMESSDDLSDVIRQVFRKAIELGFGARACDLVILDHKTGGSQFWISGDADKEEVIHFIVPKLSIKHYLDGLEAWKKRRAVRYKHLKGRSCQAYMRQLTDNMQQSNMSKKVVRMLRKLTSIRHTEAYMRYGFFRVASDGPLEKDQIKILRRFAKVFEQSYTRFLDLKNAEKQARDALIEVALERVRARSMAMRDSKELSATAVVLYRELRSLGLTQYFNCGYVEVKETENLQYVYTSTFDGKWAHGHTIPLTGDKIFDVRYEAWKHQIPVFHQIVGGKDLKKHLEFASPPGRAREVAIDFPDPAVFYCCNFSQGYLHIISDKRLTEAEEALLGRFAKVFEQSYTRFLDLQKAEAQAREAQIEAALERVRARSMAMHSSDELVEVATVLYQELRLLDVHEFSDASIVIFDESNNQQIVWGARTESDFLEKAVMPLLGDEVLQELYDKWRMQESFFTVKVEGIALQKHINFVMPKEGRTEIEERALKNMPDPTFFHCAAFSWGYLELVAEKELSKDSSSLLTRFAKVFEQCYTRFLDLQKAEAQAREGQIEAALERVRASTMAMHRSSELSEVINVIYGQLQLLGMVNDINRVEIDLFDLESEMITIWITDLGGGELTKSFSVSFDTVPFWREHLVRFQQFPSSDRKEHSLVLEYRDKAYDQLLQVSIDTGIVDKDIQQAIREGHIPKHWIQHLAYFSHGALNLGALTKLTEGEIKVLQRFAAVFEQSYTRFLDLQKAEAQAREAQIEAALERVRARAMGMHHSTELEELNTMLFAELDRLGISMHNSMIWVFDPEDFTQRVWFANEGAQGSMNSYLLPHHQHPPYLAMLDGWQTREERWIYDLKGQVKKSWDAFLFKETEYVNLPSEVKESLSRLEQCFLVATFKDFGALALAPEEKPSDVQMDLLVRFGRVFNQCYTRFLDLQKAEAQAREAQIEAALERVRAASLAMHHSDELYSVITILSEQLDQLGVEMDAAMINEVMEGEKDWYMWLAISSASQATYKRIRQVQVPYLRSAAFDRIRKAREEGKTVFSDYLTKAQKNLLFTHYFKNSNHKDVPPERQEYILSCPGLSRTVTLSKNSFIQFFRYNNQEFSKDENQILARFTKAFEQSHTRFLDLQKAEAQAREAQIEAALERVRARTMAMHHSDELGDAAILLYQQLIALGTDQFFICGFVIVDEEQKIQNGWLTQPDGSFVEKMNLPLPGDSVLKERYQAWKNNVPVFHQLVGGARLKRHLTYVADRQLSKNNVETILPIMPDPVVFYCGNFSEGYLHILAPAVLKQESEEVLARFASVFEMTYRRFLDLRKAEAQTREAQIEAALERVRAASMAMHHTSELQKVINTVGEQFRTLRIDNTGGVFICINEENAEEICVWGSGDTAEYASRVCVPKLDRPIYTEIIKKVKQGPGFVTEIFSREEKIEFFKHMFKYPPYNQTSKAHQKEWLAREGGYTRSCAISDHTTLFMINHHGRVFSDDENDVLKRFGRVFEQSYVRFLDLQKAEAQAREAQIEASLERVRAASLAMHHTEDIAKVVTVLFDQLKGLNLDFIQTWITIFELEQEKINVWFSQYPGVNDEPVCIVFPSVVFAEAIEAWKVGEPFWYRTFANPEEIDSFLTACGQFAQTDYFDKINAALDVACLEFIETRHDYGNISKSGTTKPTEDEKILLQRFGRVFAQAYTRFLDLQKAEVQAREAQVEAALERVRAKAMAMHSSEDLTETIKVFYNQIGALINIPRRCGVAIIDDSEGVSEVWTMNTTE